MKESGILGKSRPLHELFEFLVESAGREQPPKEAEIALAVFGKDPHFDALQDASVRVYVHRLRSKLAQFYGSDTQHPNGRIELPKGQYLIRMTPAGDLDAPTMPRPRSKRLLLWLVPAIAINLLALVAIYYVVAHRAAMPQLSYPFWSDVSSGKRPNLVIVGDYYIFGMRGEKGDVNQLVRNFDINSFEDLELYRREHQDSAKGFVDLDLHYLPVGIAGALSRVLPVLNGGKEENPGLHILPMSQVTPEMLRNSNIIYIGYFSALGLLRDPVFTASNFEVGDTYDEIVDKASGRSYLADAPQDSDGKTPQKDFGYVATFPGPSGNRIVVISGTRDAAVMQASESSVSAGALDALSRTMKKTGAAEALFEVTSFRGQNLSGQMVALRPVYAGNMWRSSPNRMQFPDEISKR